MRSLRRHRFPDVPCGLGGDLPLVAAVMTIKSPHQRAYAIDGRRIACGRKLAIETRAWMEANEEAFWLIYRFVKSMQAEEKSGRVRDRVAAFCVDKGIEVGSAYSFNNDYWAGISRYLALHDDSLIGAPLRFRDSDVDCYGLYPVSYLHLRKESNEL